MGTRESDEDDVARVVIFRRFRRHLHRDRDVVAKRRSPQYDQVHAVDGGRRHRILFYTLLQKMNSLVDTRYKRNTYINQQGCSQTRVSVHDPLRPASPLCMIHYRSISEE